MSTSQHELLDTLTIPDRTVRTPETPVVAKVVDDTQWLSRHCFDPLEEHRPRPKYSANFTGIYHIPRATVITFGKWTYPSRHAPESKTKDLMPNEEVLVDMSPGDIARHLFDRLSINFDGRKRGFIILDDVTGFPDAMGKALQYLTLPLIPPHIGEVADALGRRLDMDLYKMYERSVADVKASALSDTRKGKVLADVAESLEYIKTEPKARLGSTVREGWPSFLKALVAMYKACGQGETYAKAHLRRQEYELSESTRQRPGKNELDDYDMGMYNQLGIEPAEKYDNLRRPGAGAAHATAALPFPAGIPLKPCVACYGLIPEPASVCLHCKSAQSVEGLVYTQPLVEPETDEDKAIFNELLRTERPPAPDPYVVPGDQYMPPEGTQVRADSTASASEVPIEKLLGKTDLPIEGVPADEFDPTKIDLGDFDE